MSYVGSPFKHDLFVSYSHGDDGSGQQSLQPWSSIFARELERELRAERKYRESLRVFLDGDLRPGRGVDPMAPLSEQLCEEIGATALLVILMSPDYLASRWCADERAWWLARQQQLKMPASERIAVVHIWPTDEAWPAELCDGRGEPLVGFRFYDDASGVARPLGWTEVPGELGREFREALIGIAGRLYQKLDMMKGRAETLRRVAQEAVRLQEHSGQSIYLHGRHDQRELWEEAAGALVDSGYALVPGEPDPPTESPQDLHQLRQRRVEMLTGCDALILLGGQDGRALDADLINVGRYDRESARARTRRLLPCGVLDTVGAPIATPVRRATARNLRADWLDGTQPSWTVQVQKWLASKGEEVVSLG
jgi:hypothetical protein